MSICHSLKSSALAIDMPGGSFCFACACLPVSLCSHGMFSESLAKEAVKVEGAKHQGGGHGYMALGGADRWASRAEFVPSAIPIEQSASVPDSSWTCPTFPKRFEANMSVR